MASLSASLIDLIQEVDQVVFGLSAAKLQIEMTATFAHELVELNLEEGAKDSDQTDGAIACLHESSCDTVRKALGNLSGVKQSLNALAASQLKLLDSSRFLRPLYLTGKIEMAGGAGPKLAMVFSEVNDQLNETVANLNGLRSLLEDLEAHLNRGLAHAERVEETIAEIDRHLHVMA